MSGVLDTMKSATSLVRRVSLCLDGALQSEYDELVSQLADASFRDRDSLAADETTAVIDQMESVRERMAATEVKFSFRALPWLRRLTLNGEHPPRDGNVRDAAQGHNFETFSVALIRESCTSVQGVDGEIVTDIPDDVWSSLLGALNFEQLAVLYNAASAANDEAATVPMSARSLLDSQDSGPRLSSPSPGTQVRERSKAGRRPTRQKSKETTPAEPSAT